jgi:hypothetical protein
VPRDLQPAGRLLWRRIAAWLAEQHLVLDPHEQPLVDELARTADLLATLREALAAQDVQSPAWTRLAGEERQQRLAYGRLVSAIGLPTGVVPDAAAGPQLRGLSATSRRGMKAARARWGAAGGER